MSSLRLKSVDSLAEISAGDWNQFNHDEQPFLSHEFLYGLEKYACLGQHVGWFPRHILAYDEQDQLVAAMPCYEKHNSFGEFVFDWQWASAYERAGLDYYPKLVSSVPFSPLTGQRLLSKQGYAEDANLVPLFSDYIKQLVEQEQYSSSHILFLPEQQEQAFSEDGFLSRLGYQYHWHNREYRDFDDFLAGFSSKKRRNVKRERRLTSEIDGISIEQCYANELDSEAWQAVFQCYQNTFHEKGNYPSLTLAFFQHLGATIGEQIVLFIAKKDEQIVATSICFKSKHTLYGRYWGCLESFDCLHFELCFYQGIEYCIANGLQCFEPGAQGEHKITRGFLPQKTWSSHWIALEPFREGIGRFLEQEKRYYEKEIYQQLMDLSPFKEKSDQSSKN